MPSYLSLNANSSPQPLLVGKPLAPGLGIGYTIANNDIANPVWIGESKSLRPNDPGSVQVAPLGSAPIDPSTTTYIVTSGPTVQVFLFAGGGTWAPSPAQVAAQIALLGLATASNQGTQITAANATNSVLGTGIAIPIGAAADSSVQSVNRATQGINANHAGLDSMAVNPYFTDPTGNASVAGWSGSACTIATAGQSGSALLPGGSGFVNGAQATPTNTATHCVVVPGGNGAPVFAVIPYQTVISHFLINMASLTNTPLALNEYSWYGPTGTFLSNTLVTTTLVPLAAGKWMKVYGTATAPVGAAFCQASYGISEAANIPATDVFFITAAVAHAVGSPGSHAADHALHIAATGVPLIHNTTPLVIAASTSLPANTIVYVIGSAGVPAPVNGIGYDGAFITTSAVNNTVIQATLTWYEGTTIVETQLFTFFSGGVGGGQAHSIFISGPTRASGLTLSFTSVTNASTMTGLGIFSNGRVYSSAIWRTFSGSLTTGDMENNVLISFAQSIGIGASLVSNLPLYTGKISIQASSASGAADLIMLINPVTDVNALLGQVVNIKSDANGMIARQDVYMPRQQCAISLHNGNAAAQNVSAFIVAAEY